MSRVGQADGAERQEERAANAARSLLKSAKTSAKRSKSSRDFGKRMREKVAFSNWLDKYVRGEDGKSGSRESQAVSVFRKYGEGSVTEEEALERIRSISGRAFRARVLEEGQGPLRAVVPPEILAFMPKNIIVKVDEDGRIEQVTDVFANDRDTLGVKIAKMQSLLKQYNSIAAQVKKDLKSEDEVTRLSALITAILMETGIRPGSEGSQAIRVVGGKEIPIETFGAITLGPNHVSFIRDNFVTLRFIGKKGTENIADLTDPEIIEEIRMLAEREGSDRLFVTKDGRTISYSDLMRYFRDRFDGVTPTDFRKLKATRVVFEELQNQKDELREDIERLAEEETEDLRQRIVERIVESLDVAVEKSRERLSHISSRTTKESYINPKVLLDFLSRGEVADSLEDAVMFGEKYLVFDVDKFTARPLVANPPHLMALHAILMGLD